MDWIEQWFGLNPDGGDGTIEAAIVVAVVVIVVAVAMWLHPAGRRVLRRGLAALGVRQA